MATWLICLECEVKEWVQAHTPIVGCPSCGSARYAEDDAGKPLVMWSKQCDPASWDADSGGVFIG